MSKMSEITNQMNKDNQTPKKNNFRGPSNAELKEAIATLAGHVMEANKRIDQLEELVLKLYDK